MSDQVSQRVHAWQASGEFVTVNGRRIFVRRSDGQGPLVVLLHGFPSSSYDWRGVVAGLAGRRVLALDFLGFGLSEKPSGERNSLLRQADIVERLLADEPGLVHLVAHDMGTSVAAELLARDIDGQLAFTAAGALLFNGGMIVSLTSLTCVQRALRSPLGPAFARLSSRRVFISQFGRLFSAAHPLGSDEAEDQWALWERGGGARHAGRLIAYIDERERYAERWLGAVRGWPGELRFVWGLEDPVATVRVLDALRALRPAAPVLELSGLGHYPQIEQPEAICAAIEALIAAGP
jgi:pimeloyl-ACP methyl ester carboxylesterase